MFQSRRPILIRIVAAVIVVGAVLPLGAAQTPLPYIAPEVYQEHRRLQGNRISFCIWEPNVTSEFDRDVAEAVAEALLLEASFHSYDPPSEDLIEDRFWSTILILLTEHCNVLVGFNLVSEGYPDWLITSRAFYRAPFAFAVADGEYERLSDIPRDAILGSMLHSEADHQLTAYLGTLSENDRWRRFPYRSEKHLLDHVRADVVQAGLMWLPELENLKRSDAAYQDIAAIPMDPMQTVWRRVGMVVRQDETYLRTLMDGAIRSLLEDGTITELIERHDLPGEAPPVE